MALTQLYVNSGYVQSCVLVLEVHDPSLNISHPLAPLFLAQTASQPNPTPRRSNSNRDNLQLQVQYLFLFL
jgi:hypothetical protein